MRFVVASSEYSRASSAGSAHTDAAFAEAIACSLRSVVTRVWQLPRRATRDRECVQPRRKSQRFGKATPSAHSLAGTHDHRTYRIASRFFRMGLNAHAVAR